MDTRRLLDGSGFPYIMSLFIRRRGCVNINRHSCGGLVAWLERSTPIREIVSSNPRRGYTPVSAQVWHGVTPSGRDPWLGWGTYIPCNPSVWEAELSH